MNVSANHKYHCGLSDYVHTNVEPVLLNLHKLMVGLATVKTAG